MRISAPLGNGWWLSMGPLGWFIYFFIINPLWWLGVLIVLIFVGLFKLGRWIIRRVANVFTRKRQVG